MRARGDANLDDDARLRRGRWIEGEDGGRESRKPG